MTKVKVLFELESGDWHGHGDETLWAELVARSDGRAFRLLNSPFFARGVSYQDTVEATLIDGSYLVFLFREVVKRGGHSTYMILSKIDEPRLEFYWSWLEKAGCSYESATVDLGIGRRRLLSVDVPPSANLEDVYDLLERGEHDNVWMFQEGYAHKPNSTQPGR